MDKIFKFSETKGAEFNDTERSFLACASDESIDRDGEVILTDGWDLKNYSKNRVIMLAHNYSGGRDALPVGKSQWVRIKDKRLIFKPEFAPTELGSEIYTLYKGGFLNAFSVGFIPKEWREDGGDGVKKPRRTSLKHELLEISVVAIPSNPHALVDAKEKGLIRTKEFSAIIEDIEAQELKTKEQVVEDTVTISPEHEKLIKELMARIELLEKIVPQPVVEKIDAVSKIDYTPQIANAVEEGLRPIKIVNQKIIDAVIYRFDTLRGKIR